MAVRTQAGVESSGRVSPTVSRKRRWTRYSNRTFYLFLSPWLLGFLFLTLFPLAYAFVLSFTSFDGISPRYRWIGLSNYVELLHDPDTWHSLERTLLYTVIVVPALVLGGLGLALLLNRSLRGIGVFRTIFYLPSVIPVVASVIAWKIMFDRDSGAINAVIERLGGPAITWLVDPSAFYALIIMVVWGLGGGMIISLAGLQGIPRELKEAASMDGAGAWKSFRSVTLPLLSPILFFQVVTDIIYAFQTLIQPLLLTVSNSDATSGTIAAVSVPPGNFLFAVNIYGQYFFNQRFGYGSALLWVFFLVILVITLLIFRSGSFWIYYEVDAEKKGRA